MRSRQVGHGESILSVATRAPVEKEESVNEPTTPGRRAPRWAAAAGLVAAGAIAGGVLAGTLGASAASSPSSTPSNSTEQGAPAQNGRPQPGGANSVRDDEKSVSATVAAKLRAAALKAVPGGTVYRIETDAGDATYEAHMKKADGTLVTVKFDQSLAVARVESGMGKGDPARGAPGPGSRPGAGQPGAGQGGYGQPGAGQGGYGTTG